MKCGFEPSFSHICVMNCIVFVVFSHYRTVRKCTPYPQVPVASVSSGVHETGKNIDKTEALFSQERDPRFAEMYTGISGCMTLTKTVYFITRYFCYFTIIWNFCVCVCSWR